MFYAVIHRPEIDTKQIEEINRRYDPHFGLVGPHVTLVFPFSAADAAESEVKAHVMSIARSTKPFEVRLCELELTWDQWLFLVPTVGRSEIEQLHDRLYKNQLSKFLRADIPFVPHVALGLFAVPEANYSLKDPTAVPLDEGKYQAALKGIEAKHLDFSYTATKLELITVNEEFTESQTVASYNFGS